MMGRGPMMHGFGAFGRFGGFRDLQVAVPLPRWPVAVLRHRAARERPGILAAVPALDGDHGDHHVVRVGLGRAPRDGAAAVAVGSGRTARQ